MTHTGPLPESAGTFTGESIVETPCPGCGGKMTKQRLQVWESHDEAYVDEKYTCLECGTVHWVDGIDS
jgi:uncharacterized Zn finger protein